jgi:hypothetical protein
LNVRHVAKCSKKMEMKKRNTSNTLFSNQLDYNCASIQVIPAGEPEYRAKTILFFLCLIL